MRGIRATRNGSFRFKDGEGQVSEVIDGVKVGSKVVRIASIAGYLNCQKGEPDAVKGADEETSWSSRLGTCEPNRQASIKFEKSAPRFLHIAIVNADALAVFFSIVCRRRSLRGSRLECRPVPMMPPAKRRNAAWPPIGSKACHLDGRVSYLAPGAIRKMSLAVGNVPLRLNKYTDKSGFHRNLLLYNS